MEMLALILIENEIKSSVFEKKEKLIICLLHLVCIPAHRKTLQKFV
jgi:hypothetical protein